MDIHIEINVKENVSKIYHGNEVDENNYVASVTPDGSGQPTLLGCAIEYIENLALRQGREVCNMTLSTV